MLQLQNLLRPLPLVVTWRLVLRLESSLGHHQPLDLSIHFWSPLDDLRVVSQLFRKELADMTINLLKLVHGSVIQIAGLSFLLYKKRLENLN